MSADRLGNHPLLDGDGLHRQARQKCLGHIVELANDAPEGKPEKIQRYDRRNSIGGGEDVAGLASDRDDMDHERRSLPQNRNRPWCMIEIQRRQGLPEKCPGAVVENVELVECPDRDL